METILFLLYVCGTKTVLELISSILMTPQKHRTATARPGTTEGRAGESQRRLDGACSVSLCLPAAPRLGEGYAAQAGHFASLWCVGHV